MQGRIGEAPARAEAKLCSHRATRPIIHLHALIAPFPRLPFDRTAGPESWRLFEHELESREDADDGRDEAGGSGANRKAGLASLATAAVWTHRARAQAPHLSTAAQQPEQAERSRVGRLPTIPLCLDQNHQPPPTTTNHHILLVLLDIQRLGSGSCAHIGTRHDALACTRIGGTTNTSPPPAATTPAPLHPSTIERASLELRFHLVIGIARVLLDVQRHLALLYQLAPQPRFDEFR